MKFNHRLPLLALALSAPASAEVIYSNLQDIAIPQDNDGVFLNVLTGSTSTTGWHINPTFGGINVYNSAAFQPLRGTDSALGTLSNIPLNGLISSSSQYFKTVSGASGDHLGDTFTAGTEGYLGFSVMNGAATNYGWMRVVFTGTGTPLIKDWAYDTNTSGGSIAAGNVIQSGSTYTLDSVTQSFALGSAITGSNSVVSQGANTVTLNATNTYSGATTVNAGTLLINGSTSTSSAFTVNATATLGGTGSIGGSVTVNNNATLAPGASIESLAAGSLNMAVASIFAYEVADNSATGADLLAVGGTTSLNSVTLSLDAASITALSGGGWNIGDKLTLISYLDAGTGITSGFTGYDDDTSYFFGANEWFFDYNDTVTGGNFAADATASSQNYFVTMTVIPEPSTALLGSLGALMLMRRRRQ